MAKKILVAYNFNGNEVQNAVAHLLASAPSSPAEGQFYFNSTGHTFNWWNGSAWINPLARASHTGTQSADTLTDGSTNKAYTAAEQTKLAGIATGATANDTDANLKSRANHTGTQTVDTITDGTTNKVYTATEKTKLAGVSAGATVNDTDANLKARGNHTGTQLASTISDFDSQVRASRLDQMAAPTTALSMNSQRLSNLGAAVSATDAVTLQQLQDVQNGTDWKDSVRAGTTANITLSGAQTIDGVSVIAGDRVLVKNQSTASQNGIYVCAAGAWSRSSDATNGKLSSLTSVMVEEGTAQAGTQWRISTTGAITVGSTSITWTQFGASTTYSAGTGLSLGGTVFTIDTSVVVRKAAGTIGDNSATSIAVTHNLGTKDITVSVRDASTDAAVECDWTATSTSTATFSFAVAPATNSLRVTIHG